MGTSLRSSSVTLDNVDDYLSPSQACVNPLFQPSKKITEGHNAGEDVQSRLKQESSVVVVVPRRRRRIVRKNIVPTDKILTPSTSSSSSSQFPVSVNPFTKKEEEKKDVVKASMADCLACSGCVTTAETVMMEERHSLKSLRERLLSSSLSKTGDRPFRVVTISPNSWADICRHWNLKKQQQPPSHHHTGDIKSNNNVSYDRNYDNDDKHRNFYFSRFTTLLSKILSVNMVVDGNIPLQWTWIDSAREFCQVYRRNQKKIMTKNYYPTIDSPTLPSAAIDSSKTLYYSSDGTSAIHDNSNRPTPSLPLISGSCPALVCLVEKSLTKLVPHLAQSISPISMVGMILKNDDNNDDDTSINSIKRNSNTSWDHWAIMPCHDKKLEASRKDFAHKNNSKEQAVDLVISTQECVELVEEWIISQQHHKIFPQQQEKQLTTNRDIVVTYLESLPPSDVSTTVLEPKDLLEKSYASDLSPLLITTPAICHCRDNGDVTKSTGTTSMQKQMAFSSGGHANFIFLFAAKYLFGCTLNQGVSWKAASLAMKNVRSARLGKLLKQHYYEAKLYHHPDGSFSTAPFIADDVNTMSSSSETKQSPVLHFSIAHGMQTMQRALKQVAERQIGSNTQSSSLHYLEAMACPHGCVNGGGSARVNPTGKTSSSANQIRETPTETRQRVQSTLGYLQVPDINTTFATSQSPCLTKNFPRTEYHVVPPMHHTTGAVAGEKVESMIW